MCRKFIWTIGFLIFNIIGYSNVIDFRSPPVASQKINDYRDCLGDIDVVVDEALQKFNVPGIAIGIIANNGVILSRGYGTRNVKKKLPVTETLYFQSHLVLKLLQL